MPVATRFRLIIFDCDGVLIDSQVIQNEIDAAALTRHGYPVRVEQIGRRFCGVSTREMMDAVEHALGRPLPADFEDVRTGLLEAAYRWRLKAIAGVEAALAGVRLPACVASNAETSRVHEVLALTGLLESFEPDIFGADLVSRPKPAPDLFLFAADRMGVDASHCVVIEDSTVGVRAARAAGMTVHGFHGGGHCLPGHETELLTAGAAGTFADMRDLPALLHQPGGA